MERCALKFTIIGLGFLSIYGLIVGNVRDVSAAARLACISITHVFVTPVLHNSEYKLTHRTVDAYSRQ